MAFTKEGGREAPNGNSASHIAYVDSKDNQGAGSSIGGRLRKYCNGSRFKVVPFGERTRSAVIVVALRDGSRSIKWSGGASRSATSSVRAGPSTTAWMELG